MNSTHILTVAAIMIGGWFLYRHDWKKKPLEDFTQHLDSRDWRRYEFAIRELQKRGQDASVYIPRVVSLLAADSKIQRAMGQRVIERCFPDLAGEIKEYSYLANVAICREKAASPLSRFPDETTVSR